jgi:dihydrofolate synthase/folylpolyglutamate synthase
MSDTRGPGSYADVEKALLARWPESRVDPTLERIRALCDLMGEPERAFPVIHLTGTNGKTSTARMVDSLLRGLGLRTGRFTSPHLESMTERITIDGAPISPERFVEVYDEVAPYLDLVDAETANPVSYFEAVTVMSFAAFADAPVDVGVYEVGLGGTWDATNVVDSAVAVVTPVDVDHARLLGGTPAEVAVEKAGIIKPGSVAVLAQQEVEVAEILLDRSIEVGATVVREGMEFGVAHRLPGVGGQLLTISGLGGTYDDVFLPLYGAHQAHNAACAVAAVEAFVGGTGLDQGLDVEAVRASFAEVTSPGRLEIVRRSPTVILDAAHNPHGARATAEALQQEFTFAPLVGVFGVMADKDVVGVLEAFEPLLASLVCTQNSTARALPAAELGEIAAGSFGSDRVEVVPRLDDALERGIALAEAGIGEEVGFGSGGVLVSGSVITVGEARVLLGGSR